MKGVPRNYIQWKGTDLCMDFDCSCGNSFHIDEYFCYVIKCLACGKSWKLDDKVKVTPIESEDEHWKYADPIIGDQETSLPHQDQ